jgi:hypothetical protein
MIMSGNFREVVRNDERRKRDASNVQALRGQLDEIRQFMRELASRQLRLEEQIRAGDAA